MRFDGTTITQRGSDSAGNPVLGISLNVLRNAVPIELLDGAVGGVFDNGPVLAIAAAAGVPVSFGPGTYLVNGECDLLAGAVLWIGIPGQTIITRVVQGSSGSASTLASGGSAAWIFFNAPMVEVTGIIFDGDTSLSAASWGLLIGPDVVSSRFDLTFMRNVRGNGFSSGLRYNDNANGPHIFTRGGSSNNAIHGISGGAVNELLISTSQFTGNGDCGIILDSQSGTPVSNFEIIDNLCAQNGGAGLQVGAQDVPGSTDPTVVYGSSVMHGAFGQVLGNLCLGNGGYDMTIAAAIDVTVACNSIGVGGFNGNCTINLVFRENVLDAKSATTGERIGVDIGGAISPVIEDNTIRGDWLIGITCGGTLNGRVRFNRISAGLGACIAVLNAESGGVAGGGTSPFGLVCAGLIIEENMLDYSLGSCGVELLDAPVGVALLRNTFIDTQLRATSMVTGFAPLLRARGNRLTAPSAGGVLPAIGGASVLPIGVITAGGVLVLPLGADEVVLTGTPAATTIGEVETNVAQAAVGQITKITATNGGSGYGVATTCTISGNGTGATANVLIYAGKVIGFSVTNPGSGYTTASVTVAGAGTGATGNVMMGAVQDAFDFDQMFGVTNLTGGALQIGAASISTPGGTAASLAVNRTAMFRMPGGSPVLVSA